MVDVDLTRERCEKCGFDITKPTTNHPRIVAIKCELCGHEWSVDLTWPRFTDNKRGRSHTVS